MLRRILLSVLFSVVAGLATGILFEFTLKAEPVQLTFLGDDQVLQDTLTMLTNCGCSKLGALVFKQAVQRYFIDGFDFDLKKFPHLENGFYSFASPQKLVEALPHNILESDHKFDFNCFDSVAILAFERLQPNIHIDDISGPYLVTSPMITNGQSAILCATTPREAFNLGYTITYREVTERLMPKSMQDARICLTASLSRYYKLPPSTVQETLRTDTLDVLRSAWLRDGLKFSNQFEVVLCHGISLVDRSICTAHAGLLFHRQKGYSYIEKAGPYGPFVRLDFTDRVDLKPWLAAMFSRLVAQTSYYVTFNDTKIEKLVPAQ